MSTQSHILVVRQRFLAKFVITLSILFIIFFFYNFGHFLNSEQIIVNVKVQQNATKTLLFWNSFFDEKRWALTADTMKFQCPLADCIFTNNHNYLPSLVYYDAVIFHMRQTPYHSRPKARSYHQQYIYALMESPNHTNRVSKKRNNFYNLTMTYRLDSDIVWSYNQIIDIETNAKVAPAAITYWRKVNTDWTQTDKQLMKWITNKTKMIAWFVSNCKTPSRREEFVKKMGDYVPVDIFGKCGNKSCLLRSKECDDLIDSTYKFYLSFENSLCKDYVTEKFYLALQRNVIPIVYGGANYTLFAPPHSYIDAQAFPNISSLVAYLKYLDKTPEEYAKYFWWRKYYRINHNSFIPPLPICELCNAISTASIQQRTGFYRNINEFWKKDTCKDEQQTKIN